MDNNKQQQWYATFNAAITGAAQGINGAEGAIERLVAYAKAVADKAHGRIDNT